jgi:hypothetical protein
MSAAADAVDGLERRYSEGLRPDFEMYPPGPAGPGHPQKSKAVTACPYFLRFFFGPRLEGSLSGTFIFVSGFAARARWPSANPRHPHAHGRS